MIPRNVLIADDHEVTRRGLRELLRDAFGQLEVCEVADGSAVIARLSERDWDLIFLDVLMPGPGIVPLLGAIRAKNSSVPILVLTAAMEPEYLIQAMKAGASGVIHKHRAVDDVLEAVNKVTTGGRYLHSESAIAVATAIARSEPELPHRSLSARELEIFRLIARGRAIKEIASDLGLSDKTVATYLARIREKTSLVSHVEIARYALQHGLVE